MYADNQFLQAMSNKLVEISEECIDVDTQEALNELIELMISQMSIQSK